MVYVDAAIWEYGNMIMCHLTADSLDELHAMADAIGVKRRWFQRKGSAPHYDICKSKRALAVQKGAKEIDREEMVRVIRYWREFDKGPPPRHLCRPPSETEPVPSLCPLPTPQQMNLF